jgi:hypothetical protein
MANTVTIGDKFMNVQTNVQVNPDSEIYKRNQAKFYGEELELKS